MRSGQISIQHSWKAAAVHHRWCRDHFLSGGGGRLALENTARHFEDDSRKSRDQPAALARRVGSHLLAEAMEGGRTIVVFCRQTYAEHPTSTLRVLTGQVPANDIVSAGKKATVWTISTLDARLLADTPNPLVRARSIDLTTLESTRVYVSSPPAKERPKSPDLRLGRRCLIDRC